MAGISEGPLGSGTTRSATPRNGHIPAGDASAGRTSSKTASSKPSDKTDSLIISPPINNYQTALVALNFTVLNEIKDTNSNGTTDDELQAKFKEDKVKANLSDGLNWEEVSALAEEYGVAITRAAFDFLSVGGDSEKVNAVTGLAEGDSAITLEDLKKFLAGVVADIAAGTDNEKKVITEYLRANKFKLVDKGEAVSMFSEKIALSGDAITLDSLLSHTNDELHPLVLSVLGKITGQDLSLSGLDKATVNISKDQLGKLFVTLSFLGQIDSPESVFGPAKDMPEPDISSTTNFLAWYMEGTEGAIKAEDEKKAEGGGEAKRAEGKPADKPEKSEEDRIREEIAAPETSDPKKKELYGKLRTTEKITAEELKELGRINTDLASDDENVGILVEILEKETSVQNANFLLRGLIIAHNKDKDLGPLKERVLALLNNEDNKRVLERALQDNIHAELAFWSGLIGSEVTTQKIKEAKIEYGWTVNGKELKAPTVDGLLSKIFESTAAAKPEPPASGAGSPPAPAVAPKEGAPSPAVASGNLKGETDSFLGSVITKKKSDGTFPPEVGTNFRALFAKCKKADADAKSAANVNYLNTKVRALKDSPTMNYLLRLLSS